LVLVDRLGVQCCRIRHQLAWVRRRVNTSSLHHPCQDRLHRFRLQRQQSPMIYHPVRHRLNSLQRPPRSPPAL
jgi:hypothetical protein